MSDLFGNHIVGFPTRRLNYDEIIKHFSSQQPLNCPIHEYQNSKNQRTFRFKLPNLHILLYITAKKPKQKMYERQYQRDCEKISRAQLFKINYVVS